ncbi:MAG TPA: histidine kinase [Cyanobacteria bacterium UBA11149]|nr:histidine kinase [Cyanobacteria bacterium UBA11367]HBE57687.1 histidine kinase [Cyanobacteria bacterium UBA11366]HBK64570.1 histidine kinase [Cyanobacteria bacterium UBA11166]HBR74731.1 histidine kinase [Cyanobacteria bacterium UBA11159]HBS69684.1 histidine kinase [Cyanobacteria bacterium UBA11153]HBW87971.1 histidine kinase [Cyanobacteria bacterium UBA11149]HCA95319.1 histidine kinase [Cyanobacteria bacterium UBA9226]
MHAVIDKFTDSEASLQLLLFIDERPTSRKHIHRIRSYLETLRADYPFELMLISVGEHPYLAEHFRLVATPALIKIHPPPRQTLAGSNLIAQLKSCWIRWQRSAEEYQAQQPKEVLERSSTANSDPILPGTRDSLASSIELIQLTDEIFRLKQEKAELLEQLQFKDQVLSMLAHDLRSPLTAASIALDTLELEQKQKSDRISSELTPALKARLFAQARNQFRAMDKLIADILQSTKGSAADFQLQPRKLALAPICQDILAQMKEQFQVKSQEVETDIPQNLPFVYADSELVRQVIVNLLDNAIKYTPEGGKIQVSILHRTAQKIQVSICDNGPGIPEENRDRIFEDRFRLERDEGKDGYGLGLSLCQKIIRAHYGRIWVDSGVKGGGCFHFTLPIYR